MKIGTSNLVIALFFIMGTSSLGFVTLAEKSVSPPVAIDLKIASRFDKFRKTPKPVDTSDYRSRNHRKLKDAQKDFVDCFESDIEKAKGDDVHMDITFLVNKAFKVSDVQISSSSFPVNSAFRKCIREELDDLEFENPTSQSITVVHKVYFRETSLKQSVKRRKS